MQRAFVTVARRGSVMGTTSVRTTAPLATTWGNTRSIYDFSMPPRAAGPTAPKASPVPRTEAPVRRPQHNSRSIDIVAEAHAPYVMLPGSNASKTQQTSAGAGAPSSGIMSSKADWPGDWLW